MRRYVLYRCIICVKYEGWKIYVMVYIYKYYIFLELIRFYCVILELSKRINY